METTVIQEPAKTAAEEGKPQQVLPVLPVEPSEERPKKSLFSNLTGFFGFFRKFGKFGTYWGKIKSPFLFVWTWLRRLPAAIGTVRTWLPKFPKFPVPKFFAKRTTTDAAEEFGEDEIAPVSKWWNIGIKSAAITVAAAAVLLVAAGGYFLLQRVMYGGNDDTASPTEMLAAQIQEEEAKEGENGMQNTANNAAVPLPPPLEAAKQPEPAAVNTAANPAVNTAVAVNAGVAPPVVEPPVISAPAPAPVPAAPAPAGADPFAAVASEAAPPAVAPEASAFPAPPEVVKPEVAAPEVAKPEVVKPEVAPSEVAKPEVVKPEVVKEVAQNDPKPVEPAAEPVRNFPPAPVPPDSLSAMQEIAPLPPTPAAGLQPLAELDNALLLASNAPASKSDSVYVKTANQYEPANSGSPNKPVPPNRGTAIPPTAVKQTVPILEPLKEIVPGIPRTGTIQTVKHEEKKNETAVKEVKPSPSAAPRRAALANESAPSIPKDQPVKTENVITVSAPAAAPATPAALTAAKSAVATPEPALRYTPKRGRPEGSGRTAPPEPSLDVFTSLLPGSSELDPRSEEIAKALPLLESAPQAVMDVPLPAYRAKPEEPAAVTPSPRSLNREKGLTFRSRMETVRQTAVKYVVQEGDTVFRLATDKLHNTSRWREIAALNADRIQDIRNLTPGMEILLPAETVGGK